jgi:UDP-N-acetylmuramoyl-L-alanyl-D-glutamate--2,6-diaminopimelate ligase
MRLSALAAGFDVTARYDPDITAITEDSRKVIPGSLFVAVRGTTLDGHAYIPDALARGAAAVAVERAGAVPADVAQIRVTSGRTALVDLAARFYGSPANDVGIVGFTGTFGKTSTSEVLRSLLTAQGIGAAVIGSLGARFGNLRIDTGVLTTPGPVELNAGLRQLVSAGATTVILEVTSHALKLQRVRGLSFSAGLMAAIMPGEHTDFHRTYEEYVAAKRLFLDHLAPDSVLAFDADNHSSRLLAAAAPSSRLAGVSIEGRNAELQLYDVLVDGRGATFNVWGALTGSDSDARIHSSLLGRGHLRNVALALASALAAGVPVGVAADVLRSLQPLRRRMEQFDTAGRLVLDDTAAHPDSFRATFEVASLLPASRLVVVYAIRGRRGADINRRNAASLADLCAIHGADTLIVTGADDFTSTKDRAQTDEVDATRQELVRRGSRFVWHDTLAAATREAISRTEPGDLVVLIGAQGMDEGKRLLVTALS